MKAQISSAWFVGILTVLVSFQNVLAQSSAVSGPDLLKHTVPPAGSSNSAATNHVISTKEKNASELIAPKTQSSPPGAYVSSWMEEIIKLTLARVDEGIVLSYVDSAGTFNLGAEQIIYLRDLGVANEIIAAIIEHDYELLSGQKPMPAASVPGPRPALQLAISTPSGSPSTVASSGAQVSPANLGGAVASVEAPQPVSGRAELAGPFIPCAMMRQTEAPPAPPGFSPVRQPYAVKLTDPIVIIRAEYRVPNTVRIQLFH